MSEAENGAAAPATGPVDVEQPVSEQATPEKQVAESAAAPDDETDQSAGEDQPDQDGDEAEDRPRRLSRAKRYQRTISALANERADLLAERDEYRRKLEDATRPKGPNPSDYPSGEFDPKYIEDKLDHVAEEKIREKFSRLQPSVDPKKEALKSFEERARDAIPDLELKINKYQSENPDVPFTADLSDALTRTKKMGPEILNYLLERPGTVEKLSEMSRDDILEEFGSIREKLSRSPTRATTRAPKPLSTVNGGATPPVTAESLAKSDDASAYVALRRQQRNRA